MYKIANFLFFNTFYVQHVICNCTYQLNVNYIETTLQRYQTTILVMCYMVSA